MKIVSNDTDQGISLYSIEMVRKALSIFYPGNEDLLDRIINHLASMPPETEYIEKFLDSVRGDEKYSEVDIKKALLASNFGEQSRREVLKVIPAVRSIRLGIMREVKVSDLVNGHDRGKNTYVHLNQSPEVFTHVKSFEENDKVVYHVVRDGYIYEYDGDHVLWIDDSSNIKRTYEG